MKKLNVIKLKGLVSFVVLSAIFTGCNVMYIPHMQNVPMLKEKGDISGTISTNNFQGAYAVTENVGIIVDGQLKSSTWKVTDNINGTTEDYKSNRNLLEMGAGYFKPVGEVGRMEIYSGLGFGNVVFTEKFTGHSGNVATDEFNVGFSRFFIQPSYGFSDEKTDFAFSTRLSGMRFNTPVTNFHPSELVAKKLDLVGNNTFMFFEPAITFRAGYKFVKFHTQIQYAIKLNSYHLNYNPLNINLGVHFNLSKRNLSELKK